MSIIYDAKELQQFWEGGGVCDCITFPCDCNQVDPGGCPAGYVWNDLTQQCQLDTILPFEPEPCVGGVWKDGVCVPRTTKPYDPAETPIEPPGPGGGGPGGTGGTPTPVGGGGSTPGANDPPGIIATLFGEDGTNIFGFSPIVVIGAAAAAYLFMGGNKK